MRPLHIFLIRHQRPAVPHRGWFSGPQASRYLLDYDANDIEPVSNIPAGLPVETIARVYCSRLTRARQTARALFGPAVELIEDPDFNEFPRKITPLPGLRMPLKFWLIGARALWLLGLNSPGLETFRQARERAHRGAARLARQAETDGQVVLVAHGWVNAFIRRSLQKMGWRSIRHEGTGFLSVTELIKAAATPAEK